MIIGWHELKFITSCHLCDKCFPEFGLFDHINFDSYLMTLTLFTAAYYCCYHSCSVMLQYNVTSLHCNAYNMKKDHL